MGSYNTVEVPCSNCGEDHIHQSKAGSCSLSHRTLATCELEDLLDIFWDVTHDNLYCEHCGNTITLPNQVSALLKDYQWRREQ